MSLDLLNDVFNNLKENKFMQNFMSELSNYLENNLKNNVNSEQEGLPIIEDILSKNKLTTGNENAIIRNGNDIILRYAKQNFSNDSMYFVKDNKKTYWLNNEEHYNNDVYTVLKIENSKIEELEINKKDMPKDIGINDVFRIENGNYTMERLATKELQEEITNMAKEMINQQNVNLEKHRKEGHLYKVTEELGNNRFLQDLTEKTKTEFEEVEFSKDLLSKATEGMVLKYTNGRYEYYSDDGFEREEKTEL